MTNRLKIMIAVGVVILLVTITGLTYLNKKQGDRWDDLMGFLYRDDAAKLANEQRRRERREKEACPITATSTKPGDILDEGPIGNDLNGSAYPNNYRIVNGEHLLVPCRQAFGQILFQEILYVDVASGKWHKVWETNGADQVYEMIDVESVATSTLSISREGSQVTFDWYGWEWGATVTYDLNLEKVISEDDITYDLE